MPKITTCLWFDTQALEAAEFYTGIFPNSAIVAQTHYGKDLPGREGAVLTVTFTLDGVEFMGLNGGPQFHFDEAISFPVVCKDQAEVDYYWSRLTADGGRESDCGWLADKFGVSWQIVPAVMEDVMRGEDTAAIDRAMQAMMKMQKFDVAEIEAAIAGG